MLINPYKPEVDFINFPDLDHKMSQYYDLVVHSVIDFSITPRYIYELGLKIGIRDIFYYIDYLYNNQPNSVIDVGCGECIWKNWFPNIIGFDPNTNRFSKQDFVDFFDEDFSKGHTKNWHNGMALNSLHFIPWDDISVRISQAMNIVKDQFLFTFNFDRFENKPNLPLNDLIQLFDEKLVSLPYSIKLLDYPTLRGIPETNLQSFLNGHVRFILQHPKESK